MPVSFARAEALAQGGEGGDETLIILAERGEVEDAFDEEARLRVRQRAGFERDRAPEVAGVLSGREEVNMAAEVGRAAMAKRGAQPRLFGLRQAAAENNAP